MAGSALVTHLLQARLRVPDPEEAAADYERSLGLVRADAGSSEGRLSVAPRDAVVVSTGDIVLEQGGDAGLAGMCFAVSNEDDLRAVRQALGEAATNGAGVVRTQDADGCPIDISVPEPPLRRPGI